MEGVGLSRRSCFDVGHHNPLPEISHTINKAVIAEVAMFHRMLDMCPAWTHLVKKGGVGIAPSFNLWRGTHYAPLVIALRPLMDSEAAFQGG